MNALEANGDKYLSLEALRSHCSPKCAKIFTHIDSSPGKVLLYSQFRVVEGLGIMRLILKQQGYAEIKIEVNKKTKTHSIVNSETVLLPKYDGKRFIIFDGDREKTQIMLQMYNGLFEQLNPDLQATLGRFTGKDKNLRGDLVKLLMITQSGSEGISLKCVRRVLIMEPFWNQVRMDQVIGRAVRTRSHVDLPPEERNVEVFIYTSTFTKKQVDDWFPLKRLDNSMTSDTHIYDVAQKKNRIIQEFLNVIKSSAVDCRHNAIDNKPTDEGLMCYAFPLPVESNDYASTASMSHDSVKASDHLSKMIRNRKIQGRVVSIGKGDKKTKYVIVEEMAFAGKLFDYDAYKHAGVLVEVMNKRE